MRKKKCRISREKREEGEKDNSNYAYERIIICCGMLYVLSDFFVPRYIVLVNTFDDAWSIRFITLSSVGIAHDINPIDAGDLKSY